MQAASRKNVTIGKKYSRILATVIPCPNNDPDPDDGKPTIGNAEKALGNLLLAAFPVPTNAICEVGDWAERLILESDYILECKDLLFF
ncbi:MAG: hypothetical protein MJ202_02190 [Lentisphaeria bacterium]|nr:hypothetical protein [Lentisphaeria bacterium]